MLLFSNNLGHISDLLTNPAVPEAVASNCE